MGNLSPHNASRLYGDGILNRHCVGQKLHIADAVFDIGALEAAVRVGKGCVDLFLNRPRFVDQIHQFPDQDISFPVHQVIPLFCQCKRVLGQHQVSLCRKCTWIHEIPPFYSCGQRAGRTCRHVHLEAAAQMLFIPQYSTDRYPHSVRPSSGIRRGLCPADESRFSHTDDGHGYLRTQPH